MNKPLFAVLSLVVSSIAFAEDAKAPAGAPPPDMSKMGPWSRKPKDEKAIKKEIDEFFKQDAEIAAKGDFEGMTARVDFPVYMFTDTAAGEPKGKPYTKEEYIAEMKPFYDNAPKDMKVTHKVTSSVLSDSLVVVVDDSVTTMGKTKLNARNSGLLVKTGGAWKWKTMIEAGWGKDDKAAPAAAPAPAAKPAPAPAAPAK